MKQRFTLAVSIAAALASSSMALAGGTLAGEYKTKILSPPEFKATWVMKFARTGTYTVAMNGPSSPRQILVDGIDDHVQPRDR